jgi:hypothetical protein
MNPAPAMAATKRVDFLIFGREYTPNFAPRTAVTRCRIWHMIPLNEGQQVLIKNPRGIVGTVVHQRSDDRGLPEEKRSYLIKVEEHQRYYRLDDIEVLSEPSKELERYSPEWMAEIQRFVNAGQRLLANNKDMDALTEFSDAGSKIGFVKPLPKK